MEHRIPFLATCVSLLFAGLVTPASATPDTTYFGLPHACIDSATTSLTPDGKLKISNLGSSGCDGVSISYGGGGAGQGGKGARGVVVIDDLTAPPRTLSMGFDGELSGLPGTRTLATLTFSDGDSDSLPEIYVDHSPAGPQALLVQAWLDNAVVDEIQHSPPLPPGSALAEVEPGDYKCTFKISNLGSSGCDGFSIDLDTDPPVQMELTGSLVVVSADRLRIHADNEMRPSALLEIMRIQAANLDSVIVVNEGVVMFDQVIAALGLATLEPDAKGGKLKISNLGSSGCDGFSIVGPDDVCRQVRLEAPAPIPPTDGNGYRFEVTVQDATGSLAVQGDLTVSGGSLEARVDNTALGSTSHEVEILDRGASQYLASGVTTPVVASIAGPPHETFVFYDIILLAQGGGGGNTVQHRMRWAQPVSMLAGGSLYTGDELVVTAENLAAGLDPQEVVQLDALFTGVPDVELGDPAVATAVPSVVPGNAGLFLRVDPNPRASGQASVVSFGLPVAGAADLRVFDVSGRLVSTLREGTMPAGRHGLPWDGADLGPGVYFVELNTGTAHVSQKVTVIR